MQITLLKVIYDFSRYNTLYFDDELPIPDFGMIHGFHNLGYFTATPSPKGCHVKIEISDFYDYTEEQYRDVLVHEMLHLYLFATGLDTKVNHGIEFQHMADYLNLRYGLNISPLVDTTHMKVSPQAKWFYRWLYKLIP